MHELKANPKPESKGMALIVYILYLFGLFFIFPNFVGIIIAYVYRNDAPDWLKTHYRFQIRTFWIGALYASIGALLTFLLVGYLVILFTYIWHIVRCVKGIKSLQAKEAPSKPLTWMF